MQVIYQSTAAKVQDVNVFDKLDLEPIKFKLMNPHDKAAAWSLEKCDRVAELYKMYLQLCKLYPDNGIVPTHDIDQFWHQHILDTLKYAEDCQNLFGYFLHHYPYFGLRGAEDAQALADSFEITRALFIEHFDHELCLDDEAEGCRDDCVSLSLGRHYTGCTSSDCFGENCSMCESGDAISATVVLPRPRPLR